MDQAGRMGEGMKKDWMKFSERQTLSKNLNLRENIR